MANKCLNFFYGQFPPHCAKLLVVRRASMMRFTSFSDNLDFHFYLLFDFYFSNQ